MIRPNVVAVDITYKCTLRCLHCYNSSGVFKSRPELSAEQLINTFSQIAKLQPESICICGGEPLLRKNVIYDSINTIRRINKQSSINMVSNGELIDTKEAKKNSHFRAKRYTNQPGWSPSQNSRLATWKRRCVQFSNSSNKITE